MRFLIYIVLFFSVEVSFAQNAFIGKIETLPEYLGNQSLESFIGSKLSSSIYEESKRIEGFVRLKFKVNEDGNASDAEIVKSTGNTNLDREFLKLVEKMPQWKAGTTDGKLVVKAVELPITFSVVKTGSVTTSSVIFTDDLKKLIIAPFYKGGTEEVTKFINKNKVNPKTVEGDILVGEAIVKFLIDSTGKVCIPTIRQSSGIATLDTEAIRVITLMPNWIPASQNGKRINQYCDLAIAFGKKSRLIEVKEYQYNLSNEYFANGMKDFQEGNIVAAKANYKKAYQLNCYHVDALYNLGVAYYKLNQKDSACIYWNELKVNFARKDAEELIKKYCSN